MLQTVVGKRNRVQTMFAQRGRHSPFLSGELATEPLHFGDNVEKKERSRSGPLIS